MKTNSFFNVLRALLCLFLLSVSAVTEASLTFNPLAKYRIVCKQYGKGGVALGTLHSRQTALYYISMSEDNSDQLWIFNEVGPEQFTIQNAQSKEYITYNGIYSGTMNRYICMTTELKGDSSLWKIKPSDDGKSYKIGCVLDVHARYFNVRSNQVVGTYPESDSDNSLFIFYDESGNEYKPVDRSDDAYGTTVLGNYWESTGLSLPVAYTTDTSNPILYTIKNIRSNLYVVVDPSDHMLAQSDQPSTQFYFVKGTDGVNIYTSDGYYVSGYIRGTSQKNIEAIAGTTSVNDNTWGFDFSSSSNPGYGVKVVTCSKNGTNNTLITQKKNYWNDYFQQFLCYFSLDNGSTFRFLSKDPRHREYLAQNGLYVPQMGVSAGLSDMVAIIDTLLINNKTAIYDYKYGVYMLPIPEFYRGGKDFEAKVYAAFKNRQQLELRIDGETIENGGTHVFEEVGGDKTYRISLWKDGVCRSSVDLVMTFLPIVEINGSSFGSTFKPGMIRVNDPLVNVPIDSLYHANIRHRGATAMGKQKKAYAIKLKDAAGNSIDRAFLNMREDNNWILDAMAVEPGRMRNRVAMDLWTDFSAAPYQKQYEKKAFNGTHGRFVEVLLNGEYAGLYCMTEKIDRKQLKLKKFKEGATESVADTVRGSLYKSAGWTYEIFMGHEPDSRSYPMRRPVMYNNKSETWSSWEYKYPDVTEGEPIDWNPLFTAVNLVSTASNATFNNQVSTYFDLPVFLDYYLFIELLLATDNHGKNMYLYNYDQTKYKTIGVAPWDLDGTFGRRWEGSNYLTKNAKQDFISFLWAYEHGEYVLYKRLMENNTANWNTKLANRYAQLRATYFTHSSLLKRFSDYRELIKDSGADVREINRWQGSDGIYMDFDAELTYLDTWLADRLAALDAQYKYTMPDGVQTIEKTYLGASGGKGKILVHTNCPDVEISVVSMAGITLRRQTVPEGVTTINGIAPGIYLVNGQKVVVR